MKTRRDKEPSQPSAKPAAAAGTPTIPLLQRLFPLLAGIFFGLTLLKFGNPPIMDKWVEAPTNIYEFLFGNPWPIFWAYVMMSAVLAAGAAVWSWRVPVSKWLLVLPLAWLLWLFAASTQTVDPALTRVTLPHLVICAACYFAGLFALSRAPKRGAFWVALLIGFLLLAFSAWNQRMGGLDETRRYFWTYIYPSMDMYPTDYIKKISSNRVFGTLFYPNSLATAIILLFPPLSAQIWRWTGGGRFTGAARGFLLSLWAAAALSCLFWSGSKGGWLVFLSMLLIAFFRWPGIARNVRVFTALALLLAGLGGFFWTYSGFFKRGAPSVGARFDYWTAAVQNVNQKPIYGSGPGTFAVPYLELKSEESEMSRLVHNDYLQQASDSGIPAFLFYTGFVVLALTLSFRGSRLPEKAQDSPMLIPFAVWLGLTGWFLHSFIEFSLYIPGLAWTAFLLLGWLLGVACPSARIESGAQSSNA